MVNPDGPLPQLLDAVTRGAVPGAVALAVDRGGTLFEIAAGRRDLSGDVAMTTDTLFWIASMTKAIVSVAAMQLVEQGRLHLDAPIGTLLPALAAPQVLEGFDAAGAPLLRPARTAITLRQLLSHTAGYGYTIWSADLLRYVRQAGLSPIPANWDEVARTPLLFDPGTRWTYGTGVDMAGLAIEAASGESLADYLAGHVLGPLGMAETGFTLTPGQRARLARVHARMPDGGLRPIDWAVGNGQGFTGGGGELCGTARDYGRFLRMLLNGGALDGVRVLRADTVAGMGRNQIGDLAVTRLVSAAPKLARDVDLFPGMALKWGLGFLLTPAAGPHGRSAGSLTWGGLANCYYWIDPGRGVAGCLLTQILPFADAPALELFGAVERAAYGGL
jgi:CubicO group peptidase (beta-lactamase class C family)